MYDIQEKQEIFNFFAYNLSYFLLLVFEWDYRIFYF